MSAIVVQRSTREGTANVVGEAAAGVVAGVAEGVVEAVAVAMKDYAILGGGTEAEVQEV